MININNFVFAGKAIFTIESQKTGTRYTYKVVQCESKKSLYFVSLLTGQNNEHDYKYIGIIDNKVFKLTGKSKLAKTSKPVMAFAFFMAKMNKLNKIGLNFFHEGKCGKCGRKLTTPESIKNGFGPTCLGGM
jgi:hypothetical protein